MVICRIEPLSYLLLNGLLGLAAQAHAEMESEHIDIPYSPDWIGYQSKEDSGSLRFIALRQDEVLIGYASVLFDTDIHRSGLKRAVFWDIYVTPSKRWYAAQLMGYAKKILIQLGAGRIEIAERHNGRATPGRFYSALGFEPQETIWSLIVN